MFHSHEISNVDNFVICRTSGMVSPKKYSEFADLDGKWGNMENLTLEHPVYLLTHLFLTPPSLDAIVTLYPDLASLPAKARPKSPLPIT